MHRQFRNDRMNRENKSIFFQCGNAQTFTVIVMKPLLVVSLRQTAVSQSDHETYDTFTVVIPGYKLKVICPFNQNQKLIGSILG